MHALLSSSHKRFWRNAVLCVLLTGLLSACTTSTPQTPSHSSPLSCTSLPASSARSHTKSTVMANIALPGHPFGAVATHDGQWIFVSVDTINAAGEAISGGIAVLRHQGTQICFQGMVPLSRPPWGLALTHDDQLLLVADWTNLTVIDVGQAEHGTQKAILGSISEQRSQEDDPSAIEVALSQDERIAFVSNENTGTVGVIDIQRVRARDFGSAALIGLIPVNSGPLGINSGAVGLAISPDNHWLYVTSRIDTGDPSPQGNPCVGGYPPGTLSVVNLARAEQDPTHAVLTHLFVGCGPVRVILSPSGDTAWVTVQEENMVKAFSTARLRSDPTHARLATVQVGKAPTGTAFIDDGAVLVVANSNRFQQPQTPQTLTVLDTRQALAGKTAVLATVSVGAFPRELALEANRQILLCTNYASDTLSVLDVTHLPHPF